MNRLYILLTVMVVMVGALFAGHQALAKVLSGTAGVFEVSIASVRYG